MLTLEEMSALRVCVGAAIGEFGVSETTDLALSALAKIKAAQQSVKRADFVLTPRTPDWGDTSEPTIIRKLRRR